MSLKIFDICFRLGGGRSRGSVFLCYMYLRGRRERTYMPVKKLFEICLFCCQKVDEPLYRAIYGVFLWYRFMKEDILDKGTERPLSAWRGAPILYDDDTYFAYSIHTPRYRRIDSKLSFYLLTYKETKHAYIYRHCTYQKCSKFLFFLGLNVNVTSTDVRHSNSVRAIHRTTLRK